MWRAPITDLYDCQSLAINTIFIDFIIIIIMTSFSTSFTFFSSSGAVFWALLLLIFTCQLRTVSSLLCYTCTSNEPGCTLDKVDWLIHSATSCPNYNDKCVKIIETTGADTKVVRGCLSAVMPYRRDIPADHYEGCRPATFSPKKNVYVYNEIKELQLNQRPYNNITYCFCEFDHWCNGGRTPFDRGTAMVVTLAGLLVAFFFVGGHRG